MKWIIFFIFVLNLAQAAPRKELPSGDLAQVHQVLILNDQLFSALIKNDFKAAEPKAKELKKALDQTRIEVLKPVRAGASELDAFKASAEKENNLALYEKFLNPLIQVVKSYKVDSKYNIFSCPMVKKSWIQNTSVHQDVRNVYATYMLECGTQDSKY